ncbi:MAG: cysteate synthase [Methanothrix sp.]|jgi:cysteate synthase|nr:cysteate synthase [Methanothrix sp.]
MGEYMLRCVSDRSVQPAYSLTCPLDNSLLRADYQAKQIEPKSLPGIWRFMDWLPVQGIIARAQGAPVTYKSRGLAGELGLENLYISFNGCWPERGAKMPTCSFKDLEAAPTMQMLLERGDRPTLVVASAGNTARAFAHVATLTGQPLVLFVPEKALSRMWTAVPAGTAAGMGTGIVKGAGQVILMAVQGDYYDAIQIAEKVQSLPGFVAEGGARNIARRDGMGTVMLDAALTLGRMPAHYFQAVGSGTGGISAWEAALRLRADGRFGSVLPRLHLAQNLPNAPIYCAWKGLEAEPVCSDMFDDVLFNRKPPYSIPGGVRDALQETRGDVYGITDSQAAAAKKLFEQSEEIDILNAPAIAVAALEQAAIAGSIEPKDIILLNITGGGIARIEEEHTLNMLKPSITISHWEQAVLFLEGKK